jgi:hypothetical protein
MPKGPRGEKRPGDVIGAAIMVAKIATGEVEERPGASPERRAASSKGGKARASALTQAKRSRIARKAAATRWASEAAPGKKSPQEQ